MLRSLPPVTISFCETVLRDTGTVKNLGLHLDRHLSYQPHIDAMTAKCTGILIALSHARHVMPARTTVYRTLGSADISVQHGPYGFRFGQLMFCRGVATEFYWG